MLMFYSYYLPETIPVRFIPSSLKSRNVKVCNYLPFSSWSCRYTSSSSRLDLQTGGWQPSDLLGRLPREEGHRPTTSSEKDTHTEGHRPTTSSEKDTHTEGHRPTTSSEEDTDKELQDILESFLSGSPVPSRSADVQRPKKRGLHKSAAAVMLRDLRNLLPPFLSDSPVPSQSADVLSPKKRRLDDSKAAAMRTRSSRNSAVSLSRSTDQVFSKSMMINKEGGRLDIPGTGASLEIPSGALEEEQFIQMKIIPAHLRSESLTFASNSSLVAELLPCHVNLLRPAILTLPHCLVLKEGCEWKAKIYRSHHKEGSEPQWEEQLSTNYELGEHSCVIEIQRFSWEKFVVSDKIVEAKNIIVYAAGRCGPTDSMYLDIGYYWDLVTCIKVPKLNNASLLHERRTIFYNDERDLNISLKEFKPKNWTYSTEERKTQVISFGHVAISEETFRTFELYKTEPKGTDACTCHFKAGQAPDLEDYIFLLKAPDLASAKQPSTSNRHDDESVNRPTEGIEASDTAVTTATILKLSKHFRHEWLDVGRILGIEEAKLSDIQQRTVPTHQKAYQMLLTWTELRGKKATYTLLGEALTAAGRADLYQTFIKQGCSTESEKA